jgi:hypothetical protein
VKLLGMREDVDEIRTTGALNRGKGGGSVGVEGFEEVVDEVEGGVDGVIGDEEGGDVDGDDVVEEGGVDGEEGDGEEEGVIGEEVDVGGGCGGISKISTVSKNLLEFRPPPKNILFVDDADASQ